MYDLLNFSCLFMFNKHPSSILFYFLFFVPIPELLNLVSCEMHEVLRKKIHIPTYSTLSLPIFSVVVQTKLALRWRTILWKYSFPIYLYVLFSFLHPDLVLIGGGVSSDRFKDYEFILFTV